MSYLLEYYGCADRSPFALFHHYRHYGYSFDHIGRKAAESGAFLVGISSLFTPYEQEAVRTAEIVRAHHPDCKIVIGGHHPSAMPQSVMKSAAVDFAIRGEGEVSMPLLAKALSEGGRYDSIPGLVFRCEDGSTHINSPAQMQQPDNYPLPADHLINHRFYSRKNRAAMVIVAGRGCPMKCTYCSVGALSFMDYRKRSVESVIAEIERCVEQHRIGFIDFEDENLSLDRRWFLRLLREIKDRFGSSGLELRAMNGLYPPSLDRKVIRAMKDSGFKTLNLSLGSTSKEQLLRFNRSDVRRSFDRALEYAEEYGLNAVGYVICSAPFQQAEDSISDLLYMAQRRVLVAVSIFYPAPGSRDFNLCKNLNILPEHLSCMRSSALPLSHTTARDEAVTVLRLARILNFMKSFLDRGIPIPEACATKIRLENPDDRIETGKQLLAEFLDDGRIRGITPEGRIFEHRISAELTASFLSGLASIKVRGSR
jgi:anaerobic magnesium-protoporphyrin IX monomethyl ester cyclase